MVLKTVVWFTCVFFWFYQYLAVTALGEGLPIHGNGCRFINYLLFALKGIDQVNKTWRADELINEDGCKCSCPITGATEVFTWYSNSSVQIPTCVLNSNIVDLGCLGPSLAIILALSFLKKRVQLRSDICGGRPALVIAVNFHKDSHSNRFSLAVAFGAIAGNCITMFIKGMDGQSGWDGLDSPWAKVFTSIVMVLVYGIICYPFLACLMTEYKMVGAVLGLIYTTMRFIALLVIIFGCNRIGDKINHKLNVMMFFVQLPVILCQLFLIVRFALLLYKKIHQKYWLNAEDTGRSTPSNSSCIARENNAIHVRLLLSNQLNRSCDNHSSVFTLPWYIKLRKRIYQTRPDFKFSTQVISTLVVAGIFIYELTVELMITVTPLALIIKAVFTTAPERSVDVFKGFCYVSFFFTGVFAIIQMFYFLKCHREHVLKSYRTTLKVTPSQCVGGSLSYSGYQIAYIAWSVINIDIIFAILSLFIALLIERFDVFKSFLLASIPIVTVSIMVWLFQFALIHFVFIDRRFPHISLTIDNQRLYCVVSFFLFFFNILAGSLSSGSCILKNMFLGIVFLSRIDRTSLMKGFEKWDAAYMSYIGFVHFLKSFSHPVMLVFCQLLLDGQKNEMEKINEDVFVADQSAEEISRRSSAATECRPSCVTATTARNRWFLAITLLRNPDLAQYRKRNISMALEETSLEAIVTAVA